MKPGSVIVDMAASRARRQRRAVEGRRDGRVADNGVTIIAPDNLPASMPAGASAFYARNISALLLGMVKDGALNLDFEDEVTQVDRHHPRRRDPVRRRQEAARAGPGGRRRRRRMTPEVEPCSTR